MEICRVFAAYLLYDYYLLFLYDYSLAPSGSRLPVRLPDRLPVSLPVSPSLRLSLHLTTLGYCLTVAFCSCFFVA